jgi:hypothetical protein
MLLDPITGQPAGSEELYGPTVDLATGPDGTWALSDHGSQCEGAPAGPPACYGGFVAPAARELFLGAARGSQQIALTDRPTAIAVGDADVFIATASGEIVRAARNDGPRSTIGTLQGVSDMAVMEDELWVAAGDRLLVLPTTPAAPTPEPTHTGEPTTEPTGAPVAGTVPEGACAFPGYMPTYLPWIGNLDAVRLAAPDMSRTFDGGGPQGLDPGYSMISWSAAEGEFGVTLWRATQSAGGDVGEPSAPPLPDGSTGSFYGLSEGEQAITIIWNDAIPETHDDECGETTLVVGWSGATEEELRAEATKVAESLEPTNWEETWPPSSADGSFAVWPVDTPEEAMAGGGFDVSDPSIVALTFGDQVLHWFGCRVVTQREVEPQPGQAQVRHMMVEIARTAQGPTVEVEVAELLPGRWFVTAVYGTQLSSTVTHTDAGGWTLTIEYDGPDSTGHLVDVRVGYGTSAREAANRELMDGSGTGTVVVDLNGLETNVPGNVVILFYDASGQPYVAQAFALPPGEATVSAP